MSYNVQQDKFVFGITPAPSPLNGNPINWRAYVNDAVDEINVVDEKTNLLVGTIGGSNSYRFQKLPKSIVSNLAYDGDLIGDYFDNIGPGPGSPLVLLDNGNIALVDFASSHFMNGAIIFDCEEKLSLDPIDRYWVAFRPSDADASVLEKIGEVKQTADYYNNGYDYTYQSQTNSNECKFIRFSPPTADATSLESVVTTIVISGTSVGSTMTATEVTNNFSGATVLSLYNANAPVPILPATANWVYRSSYFTDQDSFKGMMNGVDEGWVWYGDGTKAINLLTYMAGFNILTGATSFIEPIITLSNTTNFNPAGVVGVGFITTKIWESHPAGVVFLAQNKQPLNDGNNNNDVTGLFSPRWVNNKIVVFVNGRDQSNGVFLNTAADINNNSTAIDFDFGFDGLHLVQYGLYINAVPTPLVISFRYELDVPAQQPAELSIAPLANIGYVTGLFGGEFTDAFLIAIESNEKYLANIALGFFAPMWGTFEYLYWTVSSPKVVQLQSNNSFVNVIIDNKFYSLDNEYVSGGPIQLGIQFDQYNIA